MKNKKVLLIFTLFVSAFILNNVTYSRADSGWDVSYDSGSDWSSSSSDWSSSSSWDGSSDSGDDWLEEIFNHDLEGREQNAIVIAAIVFYFLITRTHFYRHHMMARLEIKNNCDKKMKKETFLSYKDRILNSISNREEKKRKYRLLSYRLIRFGEPATYYYYIFVVGGLRFKHYRVVIDTIDNSYRTARYRRDTYPKFIIRISDFIIALMLYIISGFFVELIHNYNYSVIILIVYYVIAYLVFLPIRIVDDSDFTMDLAPKKERTKTDKVNDEIVKYTYNLYKEVQIAWMNFDYDKLRTLLTDELYNVYKMDLEVMKKEHTQNIMREFKLRSGYVMEKETRGEHQEIIVFLGVEFIDYVLDTKKKKVIRGTRWSKIYAPYEITIVKNGKVITNCPNCGGEVEPGSTICDHCNSVLVNGYSDFVMSKKEIRKK